MTKKKGSFVLTINALQDHKREIHFTCAHFNDDILLKRKQACFRQS